MSDTDPITRDWLAAMTNRGATWWLSTIQQLIREHSSPSDDPKHDATDALGWLTALARIVVDSMPAGGSPYDGNMRAAQVLSHILALWYARVQFAKTQDPRRPLALRQGAYQRWMNYQIALVAALIDATNDQAVFPGQEWQSPFDPKATSGDFV